MCFPYLRSGDLCYTSLKVEYLHNLLVILLHDRFPCYQHLFNHLFVYGVLFYTLRYFVSQKLQVSPIGCSLSWFQCTFQYSLFPSMFFFLSFLFLSFLLFCFLENFFGFKYYKALHNHLCIFSPGPIISNFFKKAFLLLLGNGLRNQNLCVLIASGVLMVIGSLS